MLRTDHDTNTAICCCDECRMARINHANSTRDASQPRYGAVNASRADHIARLRARVTNAHTMRDVRGALQGILDLLADDGEAGQ